ncbi:MAG: PKD domain-containing protein [Phycisphaerales bacterium]|nr:MAG: PKD domain-containing protein [Phycisphaerales bacterium]
MMRVSCASRPVWGLCASLAVALAIGLGCTGGGPLTPNGPDGGGDGGTADELLISFNDDQENKLVASAKAGNAEYAIFGDKDAQGVVEDVSQVDLQLDDGSTVTLEVDEEGRPVRLDSEDGSTATFSYDSDTGTIRADVVNADGSEAVDETLDDIIDDGGENATRLTGPEATRALCEKLSNVRSVLSEFFDCGGDAENEFCTGPIAEAAQLIDDLCVREAQEVEDLDTDLDAPRDIPLGIRPFVTVRPAPEGGTTAILTATAFGGSRPYESIEWTWIFGPEEVDVQNLPSGVAFADIAGAGTYVFRAEVIDAEGNSASADVEVKGEVLPSIEIRFEPEFPALGQVVTFRVADVESRDEDEDLVRLVHWQFGDGQQNSGPTVTHAYLEEGEFVVKVLKTTRSGRRATASAVVRVGDDVDCGTACFQQTDGGYLDCLLAGGSDEECGERAREHVEACLRDKCGEAASCEIFCGDQAEAVFDRCLAEGDGADACESVKQEFARQCLEEACGGGDEGCARACDDDVERVLQDCLSTSDDPDACNAQAEQFAHECIEEACGEGRECGGDCEVTARRLFDECRRNGGRDDECGNRARIFADRCFSDKCGERLECDDACESQIGRVFEACKRDGATDAECERMVGGFLQHCIQQTCGDPRDCNARCEGRAHELFERCMDATDDEPACLEESFGALEACRINECGQTGGQCEPICEQRAGDKFQDCLNAGLDFEICDMTARDAFESCVRDECAGFEAPEGGCKDRCFFQGDEAFRRCLVSGRTPEECERIESEAVNHCIEANCPADGGCEDRCFGLADAAFNDCLATGGDEFTCSQAAGEAVDACLADECGGQGGEASCEERCFLEADRAMSDCILSGIEPGECERRVNPTLTACLDNRCGLAPPPPDQGDCQQKCEGLAAHELERCLAGGIPREECQFRIEDVFTRCMTFECGGQAPPPPPPPDGGCTDQCRIQADATRDDCLRQGISPDECEARANSEFDTCVTSHCEGGQVEPGCEDQCITESGVIFDDCLLRGLTVEECQLESDQALDSCLATCP